MELVPLGVDQVLHERHLSRGQRLREEIGAHAVDVQHDELAAQISANTGRWSDARTLSVHARCWVATAPPA